VSEKKDQIVQARYLGDTPVVFPHLAETDFRQKEFAAWLEAGAEGFNPRCYIQKGDAFPVDRHSAEQRSDLEVVSQPAAKKKKKSTARKAKPKTAEGPVATTPPAEPAEKE
jgi:hypothetical protein